MDLYSYSPATTDEAVWISNNMDEYDKKFLPPENVRDINIVVRNAKNEKIGGVLANTRYATVYINTLWIDEKYRKHGIGKMLLEKVEAEAIRMGCITAALGTWESFNTRGFYEKLGYKVISISEDSPSGHIGYWFNKELKKG
jgi:GNAT superfamily N-acetyltransferase